MDDIGFDLRTVILEEIKNKGGWVNTHGHFDRAFSLNADNFSLTNEHLHEKWSLNDELKRTSSVDDIYERMAKATELMIEQGVQAVGTFIDVDSVVEDKAIKAAEKLRETYKNDIEIVPRNGGAVGSITNRISNFVSASPFLGKIDQLRRNI